MPSFRVLSQNLGASPSTKWARLSGFIWGFVDIFVTGHINFGDDIFLEPLLGSIILFAVVFAVATKSTVNGVVFFLYAIVGLLASYPFVLITALFNLGGWNERPATGHAVCTATSIQARLANVQSSVLKKTAPMWGGDSWWLAWDIKPEPDLTRWVI